MSLIKTRLAEFFSQIQICFYNARNADIDTKLHAAFFFLIRMFSVTSSEIIYSWVFNEFPSFVAEDSRRFISQETGNLYISKVQPSDVGSYICLVKNTATNARVLSPPTPLTLKTDGEPLGFCSTWLVWIPLSRQAWWILLDKPRRVLQGRLSFYLKV